MCRKMNERYAHNAQIWYHRLRMQLAHPTPQQLTSTRAWPVTGVDTENMLLPASAPSKAFDLRLHRSNLCLGSEPAVPQRAYEPAQDRAGSRRAYVRWIGWFKNSKIGLRWSKLRFQYMWN